MSHCGFPWQNVSIDLFLFLASELLVRMMLSDFRIGDQYRTLFMVQLILLLNFSALVFIFHHVPLVLLACTFAVLLRLLIKLHNTSSSPTTAISKHLKHARKDNNGSLWYQFWDTSPCRTIVGGFVHRPGPQSVTAECSKGKVSSFARSRGQYYSVTPPAAKSSTTLWQSATAAKRANTPLVLRKEPRTSSAVCPPDHSSLPYSTVSPIDTQSASFACSLTSTGPASFRSQRTIAMTNLSTRKVLPSWIDSSYSYPKLSKPTPPALVNTGNICFIISVLYCLAGIEEFISFLSAFPTPVDEGYTAFICALQTIVVQQCQNWNLTRISPNSLLLAVSSLAPQLVTHNQTGQCQQDAGEFLMWLLDTLHEVYNQSVSNDSTANQSKVCQLMAKREAILCCLGGVDSNNIPSYCHDLIQLSQVDYCLRELQTMSPIHKMCCGQILEARECQECKKLSINVEYYTLLTLPVPAPGTVCSYIDECFALFGQVENLTQSNNMLHCSCALKDFRTAGKRLALLSYLPSHLIIQLARFSYDHFQNRAIKNQSPVVFPVSGLDLTPFTMDTKLGFPSTSRKPVYDLSAFCVHTGAYSTNYGHYIAYCKVKDGSWYCFDDDRVTLIRNIEKEIEQPFISQNTYIIFYTAKK